MGILIAYLLGAWSAISPKNHDRSNYKKTSRSDRPFPVTIIPKALTDEELAQEQEKTRRQNNKYNFTKWTLIVTCVYAGFTILIWNSMKRANEIYGKQLEMMDRPWIEDTVTPSLDLDANNGAFSWTVTVRAANTGHSVASSIYPRVELIAPIGADFIEGPRKRVMELCEDAARRLNIVKSDPMLWGDSISPNHYADYSEGPVILPEDIKKATVDGGKNIGQSVALMLVGCIAYEYSTALRIHRTGFVYLLVNETDKSIPEPSRTFFPVGKTVAASNIKIIKKTGFAD